jgi:transcriptional regulator with XRE-family HTH domain
MNSKSRQEITLAFRENLEAIMSARKLSIADISAMAGVAKSVAHSWISGSIPQNLPAVARLADALQMNFKTLLLGSGENHSETQNILELHQSTELFDGICHVTIRKIGAPKPPSF